MKLICYLSNGYPSLDHSDKYAQTYVDAGCDMIEIDFPSHNPFLESEYISNRMKKALDKCDNYDVYMDRLEKLMNQLNTTDFLLVIYENTIEEIGLDKFINYCLRVGLLDIILCGIKNDFIKDKIISAGLRVSCYVQYKMDVKEIEYAKNSNGFVYMQGKPSSIDEVNPKFPTLKSCIKELKDNGIDRPIYCGVGIHVANDAKMAKEAGADAIFVGSTILKVQENTPLLINTIKEFKQNC